MNRTMADLKNLQIGDPGSVPLFAHNEQSSGYAVESTTLGWRSPA